MALEAGSHKVVRENWHKHISAPLQAGRAILGLARGGDPLGTPLQPTYFPARRSEKVPIIQGDISARPAPCHEE